MISANHITALFALKRLRISKHSRRICDLEVFTIGARISGHTLRVVRSILQLSYHGQQLVSFSMSCRLRVSTMSCIGTPNARYAPALSTNKVTARVGGALTSTSRAPSRARLHEHLHQISEPSGCHGWASRHQLAIHCLGFT